jgi:hypothetical protein
MKRRNPASGGTLGGAGNALARKRCNPDLDSQARQIDYFVDANGFQHAYGDRPPGRGWWSPADEGCHHHVRAARRRRRS